jgi:hypothetical protein
MQNTKSNTKKDDHNTKQIKYRWKLNLILPYLYRGGKGKAIPLQALKGPEGSWRLRLPDFNTFAASCLNTQG